MGTYVLLLPIFGKNSFCLCIWAGFPAPKLRILKNSKKPNNRALFSWAADGCAICRRGIPFEKTWKNEKLGSVPRPPGSPGLRAPQASQTLVRL
jgi:hypothetical protein